MPAAAGLALHLQQAGAAGGAVLGQPFGQVPGLGVPGVVPGVPVRRIQMQDVDDPRVARGGAHDAPPSGSSAAVPVPVAGRQAQCGS